MEYIAAGIVLYNPDIKQLTKNINAISKQVKKVIVVDNYSSNIQVIKNILIKFDNIFLIENLENMGIAFALNQIFCKAKKESFKWVLTLDQDSVCPDNMVMQLSEYCREYDVGIVCPAIKYEGWSNGSNNLKGSNEVLACMTSGSLTNVDAWEKVGGFAEDYFIDFVDNEFCMKLRIKNYKIIRNNTCLMSHQLGDSQEKKFGPFLVRYSRHIPLRYYYMIRNNLVFIRNYKRYLNVPKEYFKIIYICCAAIHYANDKSEVKKMIYLGIKDFKNRIMGKFSGENHDEK